MVFIGLLARYGIFRFEKNPTDDFSQKHKRGRKLAPSSDQAITMQARCLPYYRGAS